MYNACNFHVILNRKIYFLIRANEDGKTTCLHTCGRLKPCWTSVGLAPPRFESLGEEPFTSRIRVARAVKLVYMYEHCTARQGQVLHGRVQDAQLLLQLSYHLSVEMQGVQECMTHFSCRENGMFRTYASSGPPTALITPARATT